MSWGGGRLWRLVVAAGCARHYLEQLADRAATTGGDVSSS
jgi:hypothetical protein